MLGLSLAQSDWYRIGSGSTLGGRPEKTGFGGWFGLALWFEGSAELLACEKWEAGDLQPAGPPQSLSPEFDYKEVQTEARGFGAQVVVARNC